MCSETRNTTFDNISGTAFLPRKASTVVAKERQEHMKQLLKNWADKSSLRKKPSTLNDSYKVVREGIMYSITPKEGYLEVFDGRNHATFESIEQIKLTLGIDADNLA